MTTNPLKPQQGPFRFARDLWRGLLSLGLGAAMLGAAVVSAEAEQSVLNKGNAVITGFSGTAPSATPAPSGDPLDGLFIDLNGASMRVQDISAGGQPPQGQLLSAPTVFQAKAGDVGQVFGVALDDGRGPDGTLSGTPDIYLSATSAFGLQIVQQDATGKVARLRTGNPGAQWMAGQWGSAAKGGSPGSIWKVNGATGDISLFADVKLNGAPNSGPALGNLAFDPKSRQIFVSDLSTGMIHRFDMHGTDLGYYDHGVQGRTSQGLAPVADDPANRLDIANAAFNSEDAATWHYTPKGRMVWGVRVNGDRLYYAAAEGPQIWSISIAQDGSFGADPRLEIDVTGTPNNNPVSDITFDGQGNIYLAQRGAGRGDYSYKVFAEGKKSALLRYRQDPQTGKWLPAAEEYAVGFPPEHHNTNGGVAIGYGYDSAGKMIPGSCGRMVWTTGELLRQGSGLPGPEIVHGLQGMDHSLVRPANAPPKQSYFAEFDSKFQAADGAGHLGGAAIWQPCTDVAGNPVAPGQPGQPPLPPPLPPQLPPLPMPPPVPNPLPPLPPELPSPDLAILKTADGPCLPTAGGAFACSYTISVTNVSPIPYFGPIQVVDATSFALGQLSTTSSPPWSCLGAGSTTLLCAFPPVTLLPGVSIPLLVTETIPAGALNGAPCQVANTATIVDAPGGDFNPANNTSTATANLPVPNCKLLPPPVTLGSNLSIQKKGGACAKTGFGFDCHFTITVTNSGTLPFTGPLQVNDATGAPPAVPPLFSGPFTCTGTTNAQCKIASQTLLPGQSVTINELVVVTTLQLPATACNLPNTAQIAVPAPGSPANSNPADDTASAVGLIVDPACLKNPPPPPVPTPVSNLKISKIGDPCTKTGVNFTCNFLVTIANTTNVDFNGPVNFDDTVALGTLTTTAPGWTCGAANPHPCTHPANLAIPANSSTALNMTVTFPGSAITFCREDNTVHITTPAGGSSTNNDPADDTATASSNVVSPICSPVPKPPLLQSNVKLEKTAAPDCTTLASGNFLCSYKLTVTNTGPGPCCDSLTVQDQMSQPFSKATFSGTLPGVTCITAALPTTVAQCSSPVPLNLPVGVPQTLTNVAFEVPAASATPAKCKFDNFALVQTPAGGTAANSNAGDDLSGATAKIPIVIDPVNGAVPCDPPGLRLSKVATPSLCTKTAAGFDCTYAITIDSIGQDPFHGPIIISETVPAGASLKSNSQPDWTCPGVSPNFQCVHTFTTIPVGKSETFSVTVSVPDSAAASGQCLVPNKVRMAFTDGPLKGKVFSASAAAQIDDPRCLRVEQPAPVETPVGVPADGHVSIIKTCAPSVAGGAVSCRITVTNDGGKPIASTISLGDKGQWSGNGSPMHVLSAKPGSSAITCGGLPDALTCALDGKSLPPGASQSVEVALAPAGDQVRYKNCARLLAVDGSPLTGPGHESCVEGGGEITVTKTGPASCVPGQACVFQVTIGNASNAGFTGPVLVGDALLIGGAAQQGAPVTVSPPFGCAPEPTSLPFNCVTNASLGGHEQQTHTVTVRMPASSIAGATNGLNCFFATDGGNGAGNLARTSLAGIAPHAGNGPGYSCVSFTVQPVAQPCPGDLVRIGTQCKCPEGLTQGRDYTCRGGTRIVPIPLPLPIPVNPVCQDRERRMTSGECCPQGTVAYGNACRAKETPQRCLPPMVGTFGNCHCPDGLVYNGDRNTCVPPRVPCPDGTVGRYQPDCQVVRVPCPEGTIGRYQPDCKVVRLPCPAGTVGKYQPNCQVVRVPCPAGTSGDYQPNCKVLVPCPRGTVGTYQPNCQLVRVPCPAGTSGDYQPNCKVRVPCPRGTVGTYQPNCQVVRIPCPAGTVGDYQPNCKVMTCPQGTHGRYPVCLPDQARCPAGTIGRYQPDCKVVKQPPLESTCGPGTVKIGNFCRPLNIGPKLNLPPGIFNQPGGPVLR